MADEIHVDEKSHLNRSCSTEEEEVNERVQRSSLVGGSDSIDEAGDVNGDDNSSSNSNDNSDGYGDDADVDVDAPLTSNLHYYVRRASEQRNREQQATTKLSETIDSSQRRPARSNLRIYISVIIMLMGFIVIGTVLGVMLSPSNKNKNMNISNDSSVVDEHVPIGTPPANVENHVSPTMTPPASVMDAVPTTVVTLPFDGDDGTFMVVMEVTERRLTSIEIDGNTVDLVAETRAAAGFGEKEELASMHGYRKLNNNDVKVDDNDDEELL